MASWKKVVSESSSGTIAQNTSGSAASLSSTLAVTSGGTGLTSATQGDIIYASGSNTLAKLAAGTNGYFLKTQGGSANPVWAEVLSDIVGDTTPQLGGDLDTNAQNIKFNTSKGILDSNGNEQIIFTLAASAVNYLNVTNAAENGAVIVESKGGDSHVDLKLKAKGDDAVIVEAKGGLEVNNGLGTSEPNRIRLYEPGDGGSSYHEFRSQALSGNVLLTLPTTAGTLLTDNSSLGVTNILSTLNGDLGGAFVIGNQTDDEGEFKGPLKARTLTITTGGAAVTGNSTVTGNLTVTGDLTISGSTTTLNTATLLVEDKVIEVATGSGGGSASAASGAGLLVNTANGTREPAIAWLNSTATAPNGWVVYPEGGSNKLPLQTVEHYVDDTGTPTGMYTHRGALCYNVTDGDLYYYDHT